MRCENRCGEIGKAARKLKAERERLRGDGMKRRAELVARAAVLRVEVEGEVAAEEVKVLGMEKKVEAMKALLKEEEEKERNRVVRRPKEGGKIGVMAGVARERVQELKNALEKVKEERDNAVEKLLKAEGILAALKEGYNPNFNDEGVKTAVRAWEEYLAQEGTARTASHAEERDLEDLLGDDPVDWDQFMDGDEEQSDSRFPWNTTWE